MTKICSACGQQTLLDNVDIERSAINLGALDGALRRYHQHILSNLPDDQKWSGLNTLLNALPSALIGAKAGQAHGRQLADSINKNWLGSFESLCLACGLLFLPEWDE